MPREFQDYWIDELVGDERRVQRVFVSNENMFALLAPVENGIATRVAILDGLPSGYTVRHVQRSPKDRGWAIIIHSLTLPMVPERERVVPQIQVGIRFVEVKDR
jgi:hypothetical protein